MHDNRKSDKYFSGARAQKTSVQPHVFCDQLNGGNYIPYSIFYSIIILINFLLGLIFSTLVQNLLKDYVDINIKLFKFHS